MKPGDILENYHGAFAKVIRLTEGGLTHLSAWVRTPELAEEETVSVSFLNDFGLSQVLKDGVNAGKNSDFVPLETTDASSGARLPLTEWTVKELVAYAKELNIDTKGSKSELVDRITAKLNEIVDAEMEDHEVTEEDLANNPTLASEGVKVGDVVKFPKVVA